MATINRAPLTYNNFIKDSQLPSSLVTSGYSGELLKQDIEYLDQKIDSARKTITQWDFYKIVDVVTESESLQSQINTLLPNTSLVINTPSFYSNEVKYSRGDVIYKHTDYSTTHIQAENSGIYYPYRLIPEYNSSNQLTGNYTLEYKYAATIQEGADPTTVTVGTAVTVPSEEICFQNIASSTEVHTYGSTITYSGATSVLITSAIYNSKYVRPLVKFLAQSGEIIESTYTMRLQGANWVITDIPKLTKTIQVK